MPYLIIVLVLLAFVAIGAAAGAHELRAPSAEEARLSPIELRTGTPASERKASKQKTKVVVKTTKRLMGRRPERRRPQRVSPSSRRGAPQVLGPAPAPAGSGGDDDDAEDGEGGEGGEGNDGDDVTDGGDD